MYVYQRLFARSTWSLALCAALILCCALTVTERSDAADCTTRIGAVLPASMEWGQPIVRSAQFAVDIYNDAGGVKGCPVELLIGDTEVNPEIGVDTAKYLVEVENVPVLLGAVSSEVSLPVLQSVTAPANVMQMSCCSSSKAFTDIAQAGQTKGLWFRTFATTRNQAAVAAKLVQEQNYKSVGIFYKNDDWGQDIGQLVAADLESLGVNVTASIAVNDGGSSYSSEVAEMLDSIPEALYLAVHPAEAIPLLKQWLSLGGTQKMVLAQVLRSDGFRDGIGLEFLSESIGYDSALSGARSAGQFINMYRGQYGKEPSEPGVTNSFDATMISLLAMEAAPEPTGVSIAASVSRVTDPAGVPIFPNVQGLAEARRAFAEGKTVSYHGANGAIVFDANGDVSAPAMAWSFTDTGSQQTAYYSTADVEEFIASLKK